MQPIHGVNDRRNLAEYQAALATSVYPVKIELAGDESAFSASISTRQIGEISLTRVDANSVCQTQNVNNYNKDEGYYILQLQESGTTAYAHAGRTALCPDNTLVMMDTRRTIIGKQFGASGALMARVPKHLIQKLVPRVDDYCTLPVDANLGSASMLARLMQDCWDWNHTFTRHDHHVLPETLLRLIETVFYNEAGDEDSDNNDNPQIQRVQEAIAAHCHNPNLSPDRLCRVLGISRDALYRTTRAAGTSASKLIIETRLQQVANCLSDPAYTDTSLTNIAFNHGFSELSHFSRRFKMQYGISPAQFRAQAMSPCK